MLQDPAGKEVELVKNIINTLLLLTRQLRIYGGKNQLIALTTSRLQAFFAMYFFHHEVLELTVARHGIIYRDDFIERSSQAFAKFAYMLFQHGISVITFCGPSPDRELQTFLSLVARPAAESWEEGGFVASLEMRGITRIAVREMSESDIAFNRDPEPEAGQSPELVRSPLWDRFALAVYHGLSAKIGDTGAEPEGIDPDALAKIANLVLVDIPLASQQQFGKLLSNFLISLQREKILPYRARALEELTTFINRVSPEIRGRLFKNIFNLNLPSEFAREFCAGLADQIIVELLEASSTEADYIPPVLLKVLGRIAREKHLGGLRPDQSEPGINDSGADLNPLFRKDDFEKYVPARYRKTLLNIIQHHHLPAPADERLQKLKSSLQENRQEQHAAAIVMQVLGHSADPEQLAGLDKNLVTAVALFLEEGNYTGINQIRRLCRKQGFKAKDLIRLNQAITSAAFTGKVIDGIALYGKTRMDAIGALVTDVGEAFIAPLLERLAVEPERSRRLHYLQLLQKLDSRQVIEEARKYLHDPRWFLVRNVVKLLHGIQDGRALPDLQPLIDHPHPKVRIEAVRVCLHYGCREGLLALVRMLDGEDPQAVETGISLAMMVNHNEIIDRLIAFLSRTKLFDFNFSQKKLAIQTLAEIAPGKALPVLVDLLTSRSLTHPRQHERLKLEIVKAMERFDPALLLPVRTRLLAETGGTVHNRLHQLLHNTEEQKS